MSDASTDHVAPTDSIPAAELVALQRRSDARGLARLAGHLVAIAGAGALYALSLERASWPFQLAAAFAFGFTLVTMFATMHESVHRTAFKSRWLNDAVAWGAGLLSFYNSTFYRPYHGWHHRYTQLTGQDPELEDPKPTGLGSYLLELSGVPWWLGKLRTHFGIAFGKTQSYGFLNDATTPGVVRSVRWQLAVYGAGIGLSFALGRPYFVTYWLVPVALAQPALRALLLAEHTGCSQDSDPLANTRTTHTLFPVRFLMWEMPYHAEHHHFPALPFFALASVHRKLAPRLKHVARHGYSGFHAALLKSFSGRTSEAAP